MGASSTVRHQLRKSLKHLGVRAVVRLMRWADPDLVHPSPQQAEPQPAESDEEAAVEAALDEALARSSAIANTPTPEEIYVYAEATPNPNAMKFTVSVPILTSGSLSFSTADQADSHALGRRLFEIEGVEGIFAVNDFCTVTKSNDVSWSAITHAIESALIDVLSS